MKAIAAGVLAIMAGSASAETAQRPVVEYIGTPMVGEQRLPFSEAVRVGDILFLSGQIGNRPDGTLPDGLEAQARQTMDNIGRVLKGQGLGFGDCRQMHGDARRYEGLARIQ